MMLSLGSLLGGHLHLVYSGAAHGQAGVLARLHHGKDDAGRLVFITRTIQWHQCNFQNCKSFFVKPILI